MSNQMNDRLNEDFQFAIAKMRECEELKRKNRQLEEDVMFFKKLFKMLVGEKAIVIRQAEINRMEEPKFHLEENLNDDIIVRVIF